MNFFWQSQITYRTKHIFTNRYKIINANNKKSKCGNISASFYNPTLNKFTEYTVLSASQAQQANSVSMGLFKTIGDINLLLYASSIGGLVTTGDVSASNFYEFIADLTNLKFDIKTVFNNNKIHLDKVVTFNMNLGSNKTNTSDPMNVMNNFNHMVKVDAASKTKTPIGIKYNSNKNPMNLVKNFADKKLKNLNTNSLMNQIKLPKIGYHLQNDELVETTNINFMFESSKITVNTSYFPQNLFKTDADPNRWHDLQKEAPKKGSQANKTGFKVHSGVNYNSNVNQYALPTGDEQIKMILNALKNHLKSHSKNKYPGLKLNEITKNNIATLPPGIKTELKNPTKSMKNKLVILRNFYRRPKDERKARVSALKKYLKNYSKLKSNTKEENKATYKFFIEILQLYTTPNKLNKLNANPVFHEALRNKLFYDNNIINSSTKTVNIPNNDEKKEKQINRIDDRLKEYIKYIKMAIKTGNGEKLIIQRNVREKVI